ncbi:ATP-binding cassette sub-family G member 4 [Diachasma alloeum]|uniref:ATP-binding cassette sub-family G member 4 n=1 Tax=Diachasma alloeum TaxID=454923 RepID=UPI0007384E08|nr:ATP-binding cassette sub-family G member 4 [Diachasma alloeum]XP_015110806.1 ATP-binding cassette sub-family G member 4 [Diachasma alloeum]XP_015110807.1 ATP-binding cassette sub-family G member 4 [Diachasma alloeum]
MYQRTVQINLPKAHTIDVEFKDVIWEVRTGFRKPKKPVLKGVSGCFKSGELTAIMGPSGAGKSSLLNLLTGFHETGSTGTIEYVTSTGKQNYKDYRKACCYIQQDDQLHGLFTTLEAMRMAADLKLGNSLSQKSKDLLIDDILETLDLIKTKETRCDRLSGGQRKRFSIALELIDNPPVMFLDEPTTGLDSSSTLQCIAMLQHLARGGRTIVCTIHQPSAAIYEMFDHIYLVADGHCMFQGSPANTVPYFGSIGLHCPKYHNPADYMIEVVSKEYGNFSEQLIAAASGTKSWRSGYIKKAFLVTSFSRKNIEQKAVVIVTPPSECLRFSVLFRRCIIQLYRDWTVTHLKIVLHLLVGVLLGLFYADAGANGSKTVNNCGFLMVTVVYLCYTSMMPAVLRFPSELPVVKKEKFNNWYQLRTYYMAHLIANLPVQMLFAFVYSSVSYFMSSQPQDWSRFFMFLMSATSTTIISESFGLLLGTTLNPINGTFLGAIACCMLLLFAGFFVFFKHMPAFMYYVTYLSYMRYALEALVQSIYGYDREKLPCPEEELYCHYRAPRTILEELDMKDVNFWLNIGILAANCVVLRVVGYCTLRRKIAAS